MDLHNNSQANTKHQFWTSLRFKIISGISLSVLILLIFNAFIWIQNTQTKKVAEQIQKFYFPVSVLTNQVMVGVNQTGLHTRAYFMSNQNEAKQAREDVWQNNILPSIDSLKKIRALFTDKRLSQHLDTLVQLAQKLKNYQDDDIVFFEKNYSNLEIQLTKNDSSSNVALLKKIRLSQQLKDTLNERNTTAARKTRKSIQSLLDNLNLVQVKSLNNDLSQLSHSTQFTNISIVIATLLLLLFFLVNAMALVNILRDSIRQPTHLLNKIALGEPIKQTKLPQNEFAEMFESINHLSHNLQKASEFAQNIGEGNFTSDFKVESERDQLGNSLLQMRDKLQSLTEEEKQRQWSAEGQAKFSEIIRNNLASMENLGDQVLSELIDYVGANQGGLFVAKETDNELINLEMIASYAYNRKKFLEKAYKVHPDYAETLLGQTFLENEKIYLRDIPDEYLEITSGLGDASPSHLLIVPLKTNQKTEGVLELASFHPFETYQIEFIERICENLAASVVLVKANERTQTLLKELQYQTEALRSQEEEMRQNMEELASTQEQMVMKQNELEKLKANLEIEVNNRTKELQNALARFDLINRASSEGLWDMTIPESGHIDNYTPFYWSAQLRESLKYSEKEFPNELNTWLSRIHPDDALNVQKGFIAHIKDKTNQTPFDIEHRMITRDGEYRWFRAAAKTLRDKEGNPLRVAGFINDINAEKELNRVMEELKRNEEVMQVKQAELEENNQRMKSNESILKKALEKNRNVEQELKSKNKEAEANLLLLREIYKNVFGMIFQIEFNLQTQKARFISVSDYSTIILGFEPDELLGLSSEDLPSIIYPDDRKSYFSAQFESIKTHQDFKWEGRIWHKTEGAKWAKITSTVIQANAEKVLFLGIFTDISEAKTQEQKIKEINAQLLASEEELRQNMEELQATQSEMNLKQHELELLNQELKHNELIFKDIYRNTPGMIYQFEYHTKKKTARFNFVSDYVEKMLAYTAIEFEAFTPNQIIAIIHPEDAEAFMQAQTRTIKDRMDFNWEGRMQAKDGTWKWIKANSSEGHLEHDKISFVGIFSDITEVKEKARALEANELVFKDIYQNTPGMIYQFETNLATQQIAFVSVSNYVQNMFGYTPEEFKNLNPEQIKQLIHPNDQSNYYEKHNHILETLEAFNWEGRMQHKSGEWKWVKVLSTPRRLAQDKILSSGVIIDIDELKRQEIEIKEMNLQIIANEEELRQNLEVLVSTQENMRLKQYELDLMQEKLKNNEAMLKKTLERVGKKEIEFKQKNQEITAVLNTIQEGLLAISDAGIVKFVNLTAANFFAAQPEQIVGKNIREFFRVDILQSINGSPAKSFPQIEAIISNGKTQGIDMTLNEMNLDNQKMYLLYLKIEKK